LAGAYRAVGRIDEAIPLFEQVLADRRRVLGDDHPSTLASGGNLAYAYQTVGRIDEAIPLYEQVLVGCRRVLGDDHPDTLASGGNLAYAYQTVGRIDEAIPLYEQVLADRRRVLGDDRGTRAIAANLQKATYAAGSSTKGAEAPKADTHYRKNHGGHGRQHEATPDDDR
ncbi:tetratricopeptide repeat protein, partial [Micromonospora sp. NPDC005237]|uniref:tetratricopeptide repeat protein n=1 Tax=Micromonospora sp. NPDC005237 TaxID=3155113 RepID=UPI0033BDB7B0